MIFCHRLLMFNRILRNLSTFCKSMVKWVISNVNVKENSPLEPKELLVIFMWCGKPIMVVIIKQEFVS